MGRGSNDAKCGSETYWQLRPADAPLPDNDRMEMWLLRHSQFLDQINEKGDSGSPMAVARWDLARTADTLEDEAACGQIASLFTAQPEVVDAFVAPHAQRERLWIVALLEAGPSLIAARALGEQIGRRLKDNFPWASDAPESWEKAFLYTPTIDMPAPGSRGAGDPRGISVSDTSGP